MRDDEFDGFAEFASVRYRSLARTAYLLVGDRGHAEDLVQTALYKTFTAWGRLRAVEAAEAYTRTTMVRLAGRWGRRHWRGERPDAAPGSHLLADPGPRGDPADASAVSIDVRAALARLPMTQRAALVLRFFDDLSEADTAAILGCSPGTVKSRLSRGLAGLRAGGLLGDALITEARDG